MSSLDNLAYLTTLNNTTITSISVNMKINGQAQPGWFEIYIAQRLKNEMPQLLPVIYSAEKTQAIADLEAKIASEQSQLAADQALLAQLQGG